MANNEINAVIERRTKSYNRAVAKTARATLAAKAYEKANNGFLSHALLEALDKAQSAESKAFAAMTRAENTISS